MSSLYDLYVGQGFSVSLGHQKYLIGQYAERHLYSDTGVGSIIWCTREALVEIGWPGLVNLLPTYILVYTDGMYRSYE